MVKILNLIFLNIKILIFFKCNTELTFGFYGEIYDENLMFRGKHGVYGETWMFTGKRGCLKGHFGIYGKLGGLWVN